MENAQSSAQLCVGLSSIQRIRQMGPIRYEYHDTRCTCSYCQSLTDAGSGSYGFWCPQDTSRNAWRVLWLKTRGGAYYARWCAFWK